MCFFVHVLYSTVLYCKPGHRCGIFIYCREESMESREESFTFGAVSPLRCPFKSHIFKDTLKGPIHIFSSYSYFEYCTS